MRIANTLLATAISLTAFTAHALAPASKGASSVRVNRATTKPTGRLVMSSRAEEHPVTEALAQHHARLNRILDGFAADAPTRSRSLAHRVDLDALVSHYDALAKGFKGAPSEKQKLLQRYASEQLESTGLTLAGARQRIQSGQHHVSYNYEHPALDLRGTSDSIMATLIVGAARSPAYRALIAEARGDARVMHRIMREGKEEEAILNAAFKTSGARGAEARTVRVQLFHDLSTALLEGLAGHVPRIAVAEAPKAMVLKPADVAPAATHVVQAAQHVGLSTEPAPRELIQLNYYGNRFSGMIANSGMSSARAQTLAKLQRFTMKRGVVYADAPADDAQLMKVAGIMARSMRDPAYGEALDHAMADHKDLSQVRKALEAVPPTGVHAEVLKDLTPLVDTQPQR